MAGIEKLADLIHHRNTIDDKIAGIIGRPAEKGHVGEFIAAEIFEIKLEESATHAGYDGAFRAGPFAGKTVNVKWYAKREGLLDINPEHLPDYFLVLAGPHVAAASSKHTTRPWLISEVFLFEAHPLFARLKDRGVNIGVATSVKKEEWERARIYPSEGSGLLQLTETQKTVLKRYNQR